MPTPIAKIFTHLPWFENEAILPRALRAPTVIAFDALAGDLMHASSSLFPAATVTGIPLSTILLTASLAVAEKPWLMEILATAGMPCPLKCLTIFSATVNQQIWNDVLSFLVVSSDTDYFDIDKLQSDASHHSAMVIERLKYRFFIIQVQILDCWPA